MGVTFPAIILHEIFAEKKVITKITQILFRVFRVLGVSKNIFKKIHFV